MTDGQLPTFHFRAHVLRDLDIPDGYMKHYVPIPDDVADALAAAAITHVEGRLNDHDFRRVIQERPDGVRCLKFGMTWLRRAGLDVDDEVMVELAEDPDPDRVDVPDELAALLADAPSVAAYWETLAPSRRKMLGYHVERAKRADTRQRRARKIIDELREEMPG
ncbi:MAG: YdeI/OmpD-associated family protein [Chloroflexi bacterium]|nr:YdeI/OmpD-associated family protein [Chloroflexota bacterium]